MPLTLLHSGRKWSYGKVDGYAQASTSDPVLHFSDWACRRPTHVVALDMMCYILVDPGAPICLPSNHLPLHVQPASWMLTSCILAQACLCVRLWGLRGEQGEFAQSPPRLELGHDPLLYHWGFVRDQNRFIISAIDLWRTPFDF